MLSNTMRDAVSKVSLRLRRRHYRSGVTVIMGVFMSKHTQKKVVRLVARGMRLPPSLAR